MPEELRTIPLNDEEKNLLRIIFNTRVKVLISGFVLLNVLSLLALTKGIRINHPRLLETSIYDMPWHKMQAEMIIFLIIFLFMNSYCTSIFFRNVYPFYKDFKSGEKEIVPYTITRKLDFPITKQYFIGLDDPKYPNHEVDENFYYNCNEGDTAYLYRAEHSKYVFEKNGRFTLL